MEPRDNDPRTTELAGVDIADDRRRPGRLEAVNPQLRALLRGEADLNAPDPILPLPPTNASDLVLGALAISTLLLAGLMLRFAI